MKKVRLLLVVGLLCVSLSSLAGELITNDTGEDATGLRVVFSEAVQMTAFGDTLMEVDQTGPADEFAFSGGTVSPWGSHWMNWTPSAAQIVSHEWLTGSTTTLQGLPAGQLGDRPVLTGDLLNPDYFAHPAYVMQGVSERDAVFALPLDGIEELAFYPIAEGVNLGDVTWSVEVSHPEGIGASIEGNTLYIWGSNASWAGYGEVTLEAEIGDEASSVTIPVRVFREDKTLINAEGKKDYFVPWSSELDINRILSVEEHMRTYSKDEGNLDRSLQWSRWKKMEYAKVVELAAFWENESISNGAWSQTSQFILVNVLLGDLLRLGVNGISILNEYYIQNREATDIVPIFDLPQSGGPSKRPEEDAYLINEAHRLGMSATIGNFVSIGNENEWAEIFYASPKPLSVFFSNFETLNASSLARWTDLGADCVEPCPVLASINGFNNTYAEAQAINNAHVQLANSARILYPGPLYYGSGFRVNLFPGQSLAEASFHEHFDIIGISGWDLPRLSEYSYPTIEQLVLGWESLIRDIFQPFQQRWNKPFVMWENGCPSVAGCANYGTVCIQLPFYATAELSVGDMASYYRSHDLAFREMQGYYGCRWSWYPMSRYTTGGVMDRTMAFRLKIEDVVQEMFMGEVRPRIISIDGDFADWSAEYVVGSDSAGDSRGPNDLKALSFARDDSYWYFGVGFAAPPTGFLSIEIDLNSSGNHDVSVLLNDVYGDWWQNAMIYSAHGGKVVGFADAINTGESIELRVPLSFLSPMYTGHPVRVRLVHCDRQWKVEDETGWFVLPGT